MNLSSAENIVLTLTTPKPRQLLTFVREIRKIRHFRHPDNRIVFFRLTSLSYKVMRQPGLVFFYCPIADSDMCQIERLNHALSASGVTVVQQRGVSQVSPYTCQ